MNNNRPAKLVPGTRLIAIDRYGTVFPQDVKIGDWLVDSFRLQEFQVETIQELTDAFVFNGAVKRQKGYRQLVAERGWSR